MSSLPPATPPPYGPDLGVPKKKKGLGCFFTGLIIVGLTLLIGVGGIVVFIRSTVRGMVNEYTETSPRPLPAINLSEEEAQQAVSRFEEFKATAEAASAETPASEPVAGPDGAAVADAGEPAETATADVPVEPAAEGAEAVAAAGSPEGAAPAFAGTPRNQLSLSADEINAILERAPEFKNLASSVRVRIEGDALVGIMSLPLDEALGAEDLPGAVRFFTGDLSGRYVNGEASIRIGARDGELEMTMEALEVAGKKAPPDILANFNRTLQQEARAPSDASLRRVRGEIESLGIADGRLEIRLRE